MPALRRLDISVQGGRDTQDHAGGWTMKYAAEQLKIRSWPAFQVTKELADACTPAIQVQAE